MEEHTKNTFIYWGTSLFSAIAIFFYFFVLARMLTVEQYGLAYALASLFRIFLIPRETIQNIASKYSRKFFEKKQKGKIKEFIIQYRKKVLIGSVILFLVYLAFTPLLMSLIKSDFWNLAILGSSVFFLYILALMVGAMMGLGRFKSAGINNSMSDGSQLFFAIIFVGIGFGVYGAIAAIPLSFVLAFSVSHIPLKDIFKLKAKKFKLKSPMRYSLAVLLLFLMVAIITNIDILLARFFFSALDAGLYSIGSLVAKSLFGICLAANNVMFSSLIAEKEKNNPEEEKKKRINEILKKTFSLSLGVFIIGLILSFFFPQQLITTLFGVKYVNIAPLLKYIVIFVMFFSFSTFLMYYNLSLNQNKKITVRIFLSTAFLQIALIILFHQNLQQFVMVQLILFIFLLLAMLLVTIVKPRQQEPEEKSLPTDKKTLLF